VYIQLIDGMPEKRNTAGREINEWVPHPLANLMSEQHDKLAVLLKQIDATGGKCHIYSSKTSAYTLSTSPFRVFFSTKSGFLLRIEKVTLLLARI
jgi:hypothetical protein